METSLLNEPCSHDAPVHHSTRWWCSACESMLCQSCWDLQANHNPNNRRVRKPHQKTEPGLAELIQSILWPVEDLAIHEALHTANIDSKWFGVMYDPDDGLQAWPRFHDFGRFFRLSDASRMSRAEQYPCLVTFIGETGAGKSTLINAMVKQAIDSPDLQDYPVITPVIGVQAASPTSGDVHLFSDPRSYHDVRPIYYADCEGTAGGRCVPLGSRVLANARKGLSKVREARGRVRHKLPRHRTHDVTWGDCGEAGNRQERPREWIVGKFYPRVLFPFSDVICFVSQNYNKIHHDIENLIKWAEKSFQKSVNQPMLPHAIIVVNKLPHTTNADLWDADLVTALQLTSFDSAVHLEGGSGYFADAVRKWSQRGKVVKSVYDLLHCYYSSFIIICIPAADQPPSLISAQYTKLYHQILLASNESGHKRRAAGMLMSSEQLQGYLESAFEHFCKNFKDPFNFLDAALATNPIATTFADQITKVASLLMERHHIENGRELFQQLAPLVASSIFIETTRNRLPHRGNPDIIFQHYRNVCMAAQRNFYTTYWRCEARSKKGERCVNSAQCHDKGHQGARGKVFEVGKFTSAFSADQEMEAGKFLGAVQKELSRLVSALKERTNVTSLDLEEEEAYSLHRDFILQQYTSLWGSCNNMGGSDELSTVASHTTCFACLTQVPIHTLPCGHIICDRCLFSQSDGSKRFCREVKSCPLCCNADKPWSTPWTTTVKPPTAGLRILSLDGGGVRSIVQLKILSELEKKIGLGIPIQGFFDLIIGTSGGGIVAFGLGVKQLPVDECIRTFMQIARKAFTPRPGADLMLFGTMVKAMHHSKYKTKPLKQALVSTFGADPLFGERNVLGRKVPIKVGVTATSSNNTAYLLANYNRQRTRTQTGPPASTVEYSFFRAENKTEDMHVWEALRATAAAPGYFKSFYHEGSRHTFNDGGIKFNNPIALANEERKVLWPELKNRDPDILLSIGTGFNSKTTKQRHDEPGPRPKPGILGYKEKMFKIAVDVIQDAIEAENTYSKFCEGLHIEREETEEARVDRFRKYPRLNPNFSGPDPVPSLDAVDRMGELIQKTTHYILHSQEFQEVANSLIATLFYFETLHHDDLEWNGIILCRLAPGSGELRKLTSRLRDRYEVDNSVFLIVNNDGGDTTAPDSDSYKKACDAVLNDLRPFELPVRFQTPDDETHTSIYMSLWDSFRDRNGTLISGFPRILHHDSALSRSPSGARNSPFDMAARGRRSTGLCV